MSRSSSPRIASRETADCSGGTEPRCEGSGTLPLLLQRRHGLGLAREEPGVLGDPNHREHLDEVSRKAVGVDLLAGVRGFDEQLDDQRNPALIDVIHLGEVQQDELVRGFGQRLVDTKNRFLRGAGYVPFKTQDGHRVSGWGGELVNV